MKQTITVTACRLYVSAVIGNQLWKYFKWSNNVLCLVISYVKLENAGYSVCLILYVYIILVVIMSFYIGKRSCSFLDTFSKLMLDVLRQINFLSVLFKHFFKP